MSYNVRHTCQYLAGPECPSPTCTGTGFSQTRPAHCAPYLLSKNVGSDAVTHFDHYLIHPQLRFALDDEVPDITDVDASNDSRFSTLYNGNNDTTFSFPSFNVEQFCPTYAESRDTKLHDVSEDKGSHTVLPPYSPLILSFKCYDQLQASPPSPAHWKDLSGSPPVVTPKPEESEGAFVHSASSSLALSPYAPMPLPPIFTHESGSNVVPIPIDTTTSSRAPFWMSPVPIDPSLDLSVQHPAPGTRNPFARGSTAAEPLWPPASPALPPALVEYFSCPEMSESSKQAHHSPSPKVSEAPVQMHRLLLPEATEAPAQVHRFPFPQVNERPKDIPLEFAKSQAAELRGVGTNISLSLSFLMQFLGQPAGQLKWHCYIQGCGKQLTRKGHMVDHVRMHLDERSFVCGYCSQTFLRKADCKRHAATHNLTKGFPCNSCSKSYARKDLLTRHSRICPKSMTEEDSERPAENTGRKKRKELHSSAITNTPESILAFVTPNMLLLPRGGYKYNNDFQSWVYDDGNKENINPSMFLMSQVECKVNTHAGGDGDSEGRRKKKTRNRF